MAVGSATILAVGMTTMESKKLFLKVPLPVDTVGRIIGSILVILAYFVVLHVNVTIGVVMHFIADAISIPFFIRTKSWDVVIMLTFLLAISSTKLFGVFQ
jgi:hypothetical protein